MNKSNQALASVFHQDNCILVVQYCNIKPSFLARQIKSETH